MFRDRTKSPFDLRWPWLDLLGPIVYLESPFSIKEFGRSKNRNNSKISLDFKRLNMNSISSEMYEIDLWPIQAHDHSVYFRNNVKLILRLYNFKLSTTLEWTNSGKLCRSINRWLNAESFDNALEKTVW